METNQRLKAIESIKTLGNAAEIVAQTIVTIAGNDISNKLGANSITLNSIRALSLARMQVKLSTGLQPVSTGN